MLPGGEESLLNLHDNKCQQGEEGNGLTAMRSSKSALGVIGMAPPCLPNFFSREVCTLSGSIKIGQVIEVKRKPGGTESIGRLTQQVVIRVTLILEGESSKADMVQVLQPLKVRHCDTTSIDVEIWDDQDIPLLKDLVSPDGGGAVGSLSNDPGLDLVGIV